MSACAEPLCSTGLVVPHGFFTRRGGVSAGPYASLNCSLSGQDSRDAVLENRARAAHTIGASAAALVGLTQVHGTDVVYVAEPWPPGAGPQADAMVTDRPGVSLGIVTADCAPILFADMPAGVVAAAHAGWRGALAGVIEATVAAMQRLGATPASTAAAIGPCIAQASYEVGTDLRDALLAREPSHDRYFASGVSEGRWQFDLSGYCAGLLAAAGIRVVDVIDADTAADEARFFSHRRRTLGGGGPIGHQISIIALNPG
jgi:polyphenol oxidase